MAPRVSLGGWSGKLRSPWLPDSMSLKPWGTNEAFGCLPLDVRKPSPPGTFNHPRVFSNSSCLLPTLHQTLKSQSPASALRDQDFVPVPHSGWRKSGCGVNSSPRVVRGQFERPQALSLFGKFCTIPLPPPDCVLFLKK